MSPQPPLPPSFHSENNAIPPHLSELSHSHLPYAAICLVKTVIEGVL